MFLSVFLFSFWWVCVRRISLLRAGSAFDDYYVNNIDIYMFSCYGWIIDHLGHVGFVRARNDVVFFMFLSFEIYISFPKGCTLDMMICVFAF